MTKALFRVTDAAPARVHGVRLSSGDILRAHPDAVRYEIECGHLVETTIEAEARPIEGLTDAERTSLPAILPDDGSEPRAELVQGRMSEGAETLALMPASDTDSAPEA